MRLRYIGPADLYYPTLSLEPTPGEVYELEANPGDGHWQGADETPVETGVGEPPVETSLSVNVHSDEEA